MQWACVILSSVACPAPQYFSTSSHKRHYFRGGGEFTEHEMCVLTFSTILSETFLILRRIKRDVIINVYRLHVKYRFFTVRFKKKDLNYLNVFSRITHEIKWKTVQWELSCSMPTDEQTDRQQTVDGQTDMTMLMVAFGNFVKAPKKIWSILWTGKIVVKYITRA